MRHREPYTLYSRKNKKGQKIWYFRITDDSGRSSGRSTYQISKTAARTHVVELIKSGQIDKKKDQRFRDYAKDWWLWDRCRYIRGKRARGARISQSYVDIRRGYLETHVLPYFGNRKLSTITADDVEEFLMALREKIGRYGIPLSATTINQVLSTLRIMFREGVRKGTLTSDPTLPIDPLKEDRREKSFLEAGEIKALLDREKLQEIWNGDLKHYTINLLAASTGMRLGECQGLQNQYVCDGYIDIVHTWTRKYGLKEVSPQKGSKRKVPIPSKTQQLLSDLSAVSPYNNSEDLLFWGPGREIPIDHKTVAETLYAAFEKIGISDQSRRERNISFHSWRHFFNSYFRSKIPDAKLQKLTGHKSKAMVDHYTHFRLEDFQDVVQIQEDFFKGENDEK